MGNGLKGERERGRERENGGGNYSVGRPEGEVGREHVADKKWVMPRRTVGSAFLEGRG